MFLWLHFDGCPEALRPGSACVNQYLLLLIIKNKATLCLEYTSPELPPASWAPARARSGGKEGAVPSFQEALALEMESGG